MTNLKLTVAFAAAMVTSFALVPFRVARALVRPNA
jgi:hypothetical protein